jgi:hypothetical protein
MFNISFFLLSLLFLVSCTHDAVNYTINKQKELNTINGLHKNTIPEIRIYFDHKNIGLLSTLDYINRLSKTDDPLIFSINSYLNGVRKQEADLGFKTNNLGIRSFKLKVEDKIALINFVSNDLDISSPEQILNFNYNIFKTAEQFNYIDDVKICINNIYNYQMVFLANEEAIDCPFSF